MVLIRRVSQEELWFDEYHAQLLRETYDQMVFVLYEIEKVDENIQESDDDINQSEDDNSESELDVERPQESLTVYIDHKSVREVSGVFGLNIEQTTMIEDVINSR